MSLRESIKSLSGNKRRFFLLRIADMDTQTALKLVGVTHGTYNSWFQSEEFVELYRQRDAFNADNKQEAIQLLRRDNQLDAVLLEGKIITKMKAELDAGEYDLIRTNLAREVYSKLISDLDAIPKTQILSWEQRIQNLFNLPQEQITGGEIVEGTIVTEEHQAEQVETLGES